MQSDDQDNEVSPRKAIGMSEGEQEKTTPIPKPTASFLSEINTIDVRMYTVC